MAFDPIEVKQLLVACGRRCCICWKLHRVQVHHITPVADGGSDEIENGVPLCPNCHDEVHTPYTSGRTTRLYSAEELKLHRERTIKLVAQDLNWQPGNSYGKRDKKLIEFFAQVLDRPAFRTHFHLELSFMAFDKAMEDTVIALNTGYWRTRDGEVILRAKGKSAVVNPHWRSKLDEICTGVEGIRQKFFEALGLNRMLFQLSRSGPAHEVLEMDLRMEPFRTDQNLRFWMNRERQRIIESMNSLLKDAGMQPIRGLNEFTSSPQAS